MNCPVPFQVSKTVGVVNLGSPVGVVNLASFSAVLKATATEGKNGNRQHS